MRNKVYWLPVFLILSILSGCLFPFPIPTKYRYSSSIDKPEEVTQNTYPPTNPQNVVITFGDITDRKYVVIGDITVIIDPYGAPGGNPFEISSPTEALINQKIREQAATVGADAVILVRYGEVGVSLLSWKSREGKGRAIKFISE